ncbi:hypothetical protein KAW80_02480 [Candidatus Babeliales bacterium]|nr:hypothetical protein [Candidatus Babeliales bacterium]
MKKLIILTSLLFFSPNIFMSENIVPEEIQEPIPLFPDENLKELLEVIEEASEIVKLENSETTTNNLAKDRYDHETFILANDESQSYKLKSEIRKTAEQLNIALNGSKFFDTTDICNTPLTHQNLLKQGAREIIIKTEDNIELFCMFFDRKRKNNDRVVVIGPGFTNEKEKMAPLAYTHIDSDVLIMNFRGHGNKGPSLNPIKKTLGIDSAVRLGGEEEKDVFAVVKHLRNLSGKYYKQIVGHGICYGALIFAKSQGVKESQGEVLFDKLILDGTWKSLNGFKEKIINDPMLIVNPQKGGASNSVKWIFGKSWFNKSLQHIIEKTCKIKFDDLDVTNYLKHIKIPVLFFYGKDDKTIYRNEFEAIWNSTASQQKIACITSIEHVWNHLKLKEFYKLMSELFIESKDINNLLPILNDQQLLLEHLFERLQSTADELPDESAFKPLKQSKTFWQKTKPTLILTTLALTSYYAYSHDKLSKDGIGSLFHGIGNMFKKESFDLTPPEN